MATTTDTTEQTAPITVRVPESMRAQFDALAKSTGRTRQYHASEALREYIEREAWQIALIEDRVRKADTGEFATEEQVHALWAKYHVKGA